MIFTYFTNWKSSNGLVVVIWTFTLRVGGSNPASNCTYNFKIILLVENSQFQFKCRLIFHQRAVFFGLSYFSKITKINLITLKGQQRILATLEGQAYTSLRVKPFAALGKDFLVLFFESLFQPLLLLLSSSTFLIFHLIWDNVKAAFLCSKEILPSLVSLFV